MVHRYALRDDQWEKIEKLLLGRDGAVGVPAKDNRLCVEAVLSRYRAGIPWRDLRELFGDFWLIHMRWSTSGVWKRRFERRADDRLHHCSRSAAQCWRKSRQREQEVIGR